MKYPFTLFLNMEVLLLFNYFVEDGINIIVQNVLISVLVLLDTCAIIVVSLRGNNYKIFLICLKSIDRFKQSSVML